MSNFFPWVKREYQWATKLPVGGVCAFKSVHLQERAEGGRRVLAMSKTCRVRKAATAQP